MKRRFSPRFSPTFSHQLGAAAAMLLAAVGGAAAQSDGPPPVENLDARDKPWDKGEAAVLTWTAPDDPAIVRFAVERSLNEAELADLIEETRNQAVEAAKIAATEAILGVELGAWTSTPDELDPAVRAEIRAARIAAATEARATFDPATVEPWAFAGFVDLHEDPAERDYEYVVDKLARDATYSFRVLTLAESGAMTPVATGEVTTARQWFDGDRAYLSLFTLIFGGSVVLFIGLARSGRPLKVRTIAGLEAVDDAVGRATEMGRPVLFVPGIQDVNEVQTIAGITILSRVARTAAEYDAKVEVPTARSLVMTAARETVQAAFLEAGRPDAFNQDLIYYVTNEQFGYVAYLAGMMVRDKPAACFYMGMFYAESLILAETGNSIGAIQVAGTAQPAQLPFFVAACDYTLIGEEFFAASAYLSGSAEELGSLKGQDVGKIIVAIIVIIGVGLATAASVTGSETFADATSYLRNEVLK